MKWEKKPTTYIFYVLIGFICEFETSNICWMGKRISENGKDALFFHDCKNVLKVEDWIDCLQELSKQTRKVIRAWHKPPAKRALKSLCYMHPPLRIWENIAVSSGNL